jgi:hypothetical protein
MGEWQAFGPNLKRQRVQRGVSLEHIAEVTKVPPDTWAALERNDLSRWPVGIYARSYVRAYAVEVGLDPEVTVDEFCRCFPNGDRRVDRIVQGQAAIIGHNLSWRDDLVGSTTDEKRATPTMAHAAPAPNLTSTLMSRGVAVVADLLAVIAVAAALSIVPLAWGMVLGVVALIYHAASLLLLGCTPAVWVVDTYLSNRYPETSRAGRPRFLRPLRSSHRVKA